MSDAARERECRRERLGGEISIVIPAYNEAKRIVASLEDILRFAEANFDEFEIIVVDDGSRDKTLEVVRDLGHPRIRCLENEINSGKGFSVRRGMLAARHDPVLFTDADLSAPIADLRALLAAIRDGADIAIGSRKLSRDQTVERSLARKFMSWAFSFAVNVIAVRGIRDTQCGFKLFRRSCIRQIFSYQLINRWGFDVEVLTLARIRGLRVVEVAVSWFESEGTRLHWSTPLSMLLEICRVRWNAIRGRYRRRPEIEESVQALDA